MSEGPLQGARGRESTLSIQPCDGGALLRVRVKPKARTTAVQGVYSDVLKLAVKAAPERGKANDAVCRLLAAVLDVPIRAVTVVRGASSHDKTVRIEGTTAEACRARLETLLR